jgi:hypothetical protein
MKTKNKKYHCRIKDILFGSIAFAITLAVFGQMSCKKLVDVEAPVTKLTTASAFSNDNTAISVLTGHFVDLSASNLSTFGSIVNVSKFTGLSSDELSLWEGTPDPKMIAYYTNNLITGQMNTAGDECWPYIYIYTCNTAIEHIGASTTLSSPVKQQLIGEAKFMRAMYYFYLVNLYEDVPLVLSTDYTINRLLSRTSKVQVYQQIIKDLLDAKSLLSSDFLNGGLVKYPSVSASERVRPTKWAASALLSRAYLYNLEWANAEIESSVLIENSATFGLVPLNDVFKKNSREAIWQLQPINVGMNTGDGGFFLLSDAGPNEYNPVYLNNSLLDVFEPGDSRNTDGNWINSVVVSGITYRYPFKYKLGYGTDVGVEYLMMFRLGEQYLIRAEARANQNNLSGAIDDINAIRNRARAVPTLAVPNPLPALQSNLSQAQVLNSILHERQTELFTEGHRWFDLKRTGKIDAVMTLVAPTKGGSWEATDKLYPIPYYDIQRNPNLTQNRGY